MKYNWSVIGHEKQLELLERDLESGKLAHAYLLVGPNSIGKFTVARKLAGILQCENDFCHNCRNCEQVEKNCHIDTIQMKGSRESLKIEDVRKLVERLSMSSQSRHTVVLIQTIERMTTEAANSFLKILEEPPKKTIFIMTTNALKLLLPTVVSRVRLLKFNVVSVNYLHKKLREIYPDQDEEVIKKVSLLSLGKTGKAISLMENPELLAKYIKIYHDVQNFLDHKNIHDRFAYVERLLEEENQTDIFLGILKNVLRTKILGGDRASKKHINTLSKIEDTGILLKHNVNKRLALENLMINL
ncbi:DNA polymerase III subunit [Patescibacteria group bacterium]|nr:DNA polymerase III subunit [Patescibacteria group bacterium]